MHSSTLSSVLSSRLPLTTPVCYLFRPLQRVQHDWTACVFLHKGERARRRDLRTHLYAAVMCCDMLHKVMVYSLLLSLTGSGAGSACACRMLRRLFEHHLWAPPYLEIPAVLWKYQQSCNLQPTESAGCCTMCCCSPCWPHSLLRLCWLPCWFAQGSCSKGDACKDCHNVFEYHMHPANFRTKMCHDGANCMRSFCFFAHNLSELR